MRLQNQGFTLVELVVVITLVAVVATITAQMDLGVTPNAIRFEETRNKLNSLRVAILGNDTVNEEGKRTSFGYVGDMGRMPFILTDLITLGTQPAWVYDATVGFGYGWHGPYVSSAITGAQGVDKD